MVVGDGLKGAVKLEKGDKQADCQQSLRVEEGVQESSRQSQKKV